MTYDVIYESRHPTRNVIEKEAGVPAGRIRLIPASLPKPFRWHHATAVSATIRATGGVAVDRTDVPRRAPADALAGDARRRARRAAPAADADYAPARRPADAPADARRRARRRREPRHG